MTFVTNNNQETVLSGTWDNSAAAYTRLRLNVQDLASSSVSNLLNLQTSGTTRFRVRKDGYTSVERLAFNFYESITGSTNYYFQQISNGWGWYSNGTNAFGFLGDAFYHTNVGIAWCSDAFNIGSTTDLRLVRDAANTFAQRNGTAAQTFRIYNTYGGIPAGTDFERASLGWNASAFEIETEAGGLGSARSLILGTSGTPRLFISSTGQIGIGNQTPTATLHVSGNAIITSSLSVSAGATISGTLTVYQTATGQRVYDYRNPSGNNLYYSLMDTSNFHHYYGVRPYHNLNGNGYVFDGNNNPNSSVSIGGQASLVLNPSLDGTYEGIKYGTGTYATSSIPTPLATLLTSKTWAWNGSNGYSLYSVMGIRMRQLSQSNDDARFSIYAWPQGAGTPTEAFNILSKNSNVGIGVINPDARLHVVSPSVLVARFQTSGNTQNSGWELNVGNPGSYDGWFMVTRAGQSVPGDLAFDTAGRARFADTIVVKGASLTSDATHVLAQRSDTNSQKFRVYNTYDGSNFEALEIGHRLYSGRQYQYVSAITSGTGAANIGMAIVPASGGSFSLAVPDGSATGGNIRGDQAVDLQIYRTLNTQVAAGAGSFTVGGRNRAAVQYGIAMGDNNSVTGSAYAIAIGRSCGAQGQAAIALGESNVATGDFSFSVGYANGSYNRASITLGERAVSNKRNHLVFAGGGFGNDGNTAQFGLTVLRNQTTSSVSSVYLTHDNIGVYLDVETNKTVAAELVVVAREVSGLNHAMFKRMFLFERTVNASQIIGTVQTIGTDIGSNAGSPPTEWSINISINDTTDKLLIECVDSRLTTNVRWVGQLRLTEVLYA